MDNVRATEDWNVELETSQVDPLLGETYVQFAWKGLQHQLSQGAGTWHLTDGRRTSYYKLIDSVLPGVPVSDKHEKDFFDGIDTSLPSLWFRLGEDRDKNAWLRVDLDWIQHTIDDATTAVDKSPQAATVPLLRGLYLTRKLTARVAASQLTPIEKADVLAELRTKEQQFEHAANLSLGLELGAGPGTPDGRPMAEEFATSSNGPVLGAVITAGKPFLMVAKFRNGSSRRDGSPSCSWIKCPTMLRRARAVRSCFG
jgi:hypothetical protein